MTFLKKSVVHSIAAFMFLMPVCQFFNTYAQGLQGEYLVTQDWRDLHTRYSPLANPAFLTEENYFTFRLAEALVLQTFHLTEVGVTLPIGLYQSVGLSYFGQGAGSIPPTDPTIQDSITYLESFVSDLKNLFMLSYANNLWGRLSVGANFSLAYETNFGSDANIATAADLGGSYRLLFDPVLGEHLVGLTLQNILAPASFGRYSYSNNVKLSWLGYYFDRQLESGFDFASKNLYNTVSKKDTTQLVENKFNFRLGVWLLRILNLYGLVGNDYYGFAGGVNVPHVTNGRDFSVLYQFVKKYEASDDYLHTIYIRLQIGPHREEVYAAKMARFIDLAPNELYIKALKLFYGGKYWDAFFIFSQILVQYPNFFKNDWCKYYKGACLEKLDMRETGMENYIQAKQTYPKSAIIPYVNLGMMRIDYREDAGNLVYDQFVEMNKPEVPDSLKYHAYYLMGQTYFKQKNYQQAAQMFSQIPETHPEYIFAQHSLGITHIMVLNMEDALNALGNCIEAKAETDPQKEAVNRSYVMVGYIFYEQMALSKAVTALRTVPKSSYYYSDALLGLAWTALRARQWNDCVTMGEALQNSTTQPPLQCDGSLISGYAYMMQKNYDQAYNILQAAQVKAQSLKSPSPDTLERERNKYRTNRKDYSDLSKSVDKISEELQSSLVLQKIDSMHKDQVGEKKKLDDYYVFSDEFGRTKFFARNIDVIKSDIDYALAISQKISHQNVKGAAQDQIKDKSNEIDQEIEKLKKEMDRLNSGDKTTGEKKQKNKGNEQ
jgi:tetratricopeptide (TPR) repeat protein